MDRFINSMICVTLLHLCRCVILGAGNNATALRCVAGLYLQARNHGGQCPQIMLCPE